MTTPNISYPEPASALSAESRTREAILKLKQAKLVLRSHIIQLLENRFIHNNSIQQNLTKLFPKDI